MTKHLNTNDGVVDGMMKVWSPGHVVNNINYYCWTQNELHRFNNHNCCDINWKMMNESRFLSKVFGNKTFDKNRDFYFVFLYYSFWIAIYLDDCMLTLLLYIIIFY